MHLNELFNWINDQKGSCHLKQWIKDCLGYNQSLRKDPLRIKDFSGDTTAKIICLNFLKDEHLIIPLGKLEAPPEASETDRKQALEAIWKELITGFPKTIQEIRDL